ncbi:MAG: DUF4175 domain-containing protein, partial [Candidatus Krumholzibacteria bacterium]|nr:DUF4175 domain-containing protein [Candidatus Krumholzibacteria bacterium]
MDTQSEQLRQYLKTILRRTALLHFGSGMVSFAAVGAWVFLALVIWTAAADEPGLAAVTVVGRGALLVLVAALLYFVAWPLARMPRLEQLAAEVERRRDLREIVRAGFEFSKDPAAARRYSGALVSEVIRQAVEKVSGLQVRNLFLSRRVIALVPVAFGGLFVLLVAALISPGLLSEAGRRMASPSSAAIGSHRANIYAQPGSITVLAGSDVTVTGLDLGRSQDDVTITYTIAQDFWKTEPTARVARDAAGPAHELQFDKYEYAFHDLRHTVRYAFNAGDYSSPTYTITVVHEPILSAMRVTLTPPAYTGESPAVYEDDGGNVQALEGTKVDVSGTSNNPLAAAWVRFDDKEKRAVSVADREVRFGFTALEDGHYSVLLEDTMGFDTGDPLVYAIEVFQDHAPSIDVITPGADAMLPRNRKLDVGFIAADDYGVRSAAILFRKTGETEFSSLSVPLGEARGRKEVAAAHEWDLSEVELFPGNSIEYYVQVTDNNVVTGPGVARSKIYLISVPTMAELYERVKEADTQREDMVEQAIRDSQEFQERLEKISREFTKTETMEWTQKKEVDKAIET